MEYKLELKIIQYLNTHYKDWEFGYSNLSESLETWLDSDLDIDIDIYYPLIVIIFDNKSKFVVFSCHLYEKQFIKITFGNTINGGFKIKKQFDTYNRNVIFEEYIHTNINSLDDFIKAIKDSNQMKTISNCMPCQDKLTTEEKHKLLNYFHGKFK